MSEQLISAKPLPQRYQSLTVNGETTLYPEVRFSAEDMALGEFTYQTRQQSFGGGSISQILKPNPMRFYFLISVLSSGGVVAIAPTPMPGVGLGIPVALNGYFPASYKDIGSAVASEWMASSAAGFSVYVLEGLLLK